MGGFFFWHEGVMTLKHFNEDLLQCDLIKFVRIVMTRVLVLGRLIIICFFASSYSHSFQKKMGTRNTGNLNACFGHGALACRHRWRVKI